MKRVLAVLTLAATAALLVVGVGSAPAFAVESCPLGFTLTSGGVGEEDLNGDGLTCEAAGIFDGSPAVIALDNGPGVLRESTFGACPDDFARITDPLNSSGADRNGNGFVCRKAAGNSQSGAKEVLIDDNKPLEEEPN